MFYISNLLVLINKLKRSNMYFTRILICKLCFRCYIWLVVMMVWEIVFSLVLRFEWLCKSSFSQSVIENSFLDATPNATLLPSLLNQVLMLLVELQNCYYHVQQHLRLRLVLTLRKTNKSQYHLLQILYIYIL
jgi:hypothetical protein